MMKSFYAAVVLLFTTCIATAQAPGRSTTGGGGNMSGRFYGKIVDASNKPIDAASVTLVQGKPDATTGSVAESIVAGMLTRANGDFSLENVPAAASYTLRVTGIGYKQFEQKVSFDRPSGNGSSAMSALDKDLGNIKLEVDDKVLQNVTVTTAAKPMLQMGIDRKIFNVDRNLTSAGGTAVDIMRNVPSLNVDVDGNVTLRNNSPQIFVDGRPTNLTLEQIPADAIESVEIITNPSAKFDASGGGAGILNVVLKKNRRVGYNGNVRANIDSRARVGLGGDINLRQQKVNFFLSGNYNQRKSISTGNQTRITNSNTSQSTLSQSDRNVSEGNFRFFRTGLDFFINNRNTLSLSGNMARGNFEPYNRSLISIAQQKPVISNSYNERLANTDGGFRNLGAQLSYKYNFPKAGKELTTDLTYNRSKNDNTNDVLSNTYATPGAPLDYYFRQLQLGQGSNENLVYQLDFVNPLTEKSKMEMGARTSFRTVDSRNDFYLDTATGNLYYAPERSIVFDSRDQVHAAYVSYSRQLKTLNYQLGLRAESSTYTGNLPDKGQTFDINFPLSLFPSVFLSQKLGDDQDLQLNYSRRINRPNFWQLFPFTDYTDTLSITRGNPALSPEFTNSIEVSYQKIFKNRDNFLASLYFKNTNDLISRIFVEEADTVVKQNILVNTYINANRSYITGLELTSRNNLTKFWDMNANLNLFVSEIDINVPGQTPQDALFSYFFKINNTFKLMKNLSFQLSADYQSKTILPAGGGGGFGGGRGGFGGGFGSQSTAQGYIKPNYGVDAALRFEFLKNRAASVSINMQDILRTRKFQSVSESPTFYQEISRRRDPQVARINFNWRFGKMDPNLFKRKNQSGEREGNNIETGF